MYKNPIEFIVKGLKGQGQRKNKRLCYHCYDNGDREFIYRPIIGAGVSHVDSAGVPQLSWADFYQTLYPFPGYKDIPADAVQLTYDRHYFMEIHDILDAALKPPDLSAEDAGGNDYFSRIAEERCAEIQGKLNPKVKWAFMTKILGAALIMEMVVWGIAYATK